MMNSVPAFKSAPWCFNGHAHTVLCSLVFDSPNLHSEKIRIDTPDEDFLELDVVNRGTGKPVVVLFHGLEGNSRRFYITQLAEHLINRNFSVVAMNFRSCGGRMNNQRRFYHSGETEDLETVFNWVHESFPASKIYAAGFSLGGSTLLNYLKKHGTHHPLRAGAVISTPFDLKQGSVNLEKGFNRIYSLLFLQTLVKKLEEKQQTYPDLPGFKGSTLYEFDDQVTGPIHGFENAEDYYHQCSSGFFIDQIQTETLVIHSQQDPLCPFEWTPAEQIQNNSKFTAYFPRKGGHVGFWSLPNGWLNQKIGDYFSSFT
ncbi:YheT family hydrolase [Rhodohalobacter sp. 614A]|uniref:YheT family hydrolase n=1 Tax=Rhodohalobacter sp. 614A TaxID=2908649 RepID=UPI001F25BB21|nr:alpha/beta fold hydrolase [Rhodohalobacter sp. 614A]